MLLHQMQRGLHMTLLVCAASCVLILLAHPASASARPTEPVPRTAEATPSLGDAAIIASAFAPTLVFHPNERYFPVPPLFPIEDLGQLRRTEAAIEQLATPEIRRDIYDGLSRREQLARASLTYRVYPTTVDGRPMIVVEYWCNYVFNAYEFYGTGVPWQAPDNHFNDLERVFFVLERRDASRESLTGIAAARRAYAVRRIIASAHDGSVSANVLDVPLERAIELPVAILVEKGSHAMAPDANNDGVIESGVDVNGSTIFLWGIRDHGETGVGYRPEYTDARTDGVHLCSADANPGARDCVPYTLQRAEPLQDWFLGPALSVETRNRVVGRTSLLVRWFGDAEIEDLVVPRDRSNGDVMNRMEFHGAAAESGFSLSAALASGVPPISFGLRRAWQTRQRWAPNLIAAVDFMADRHGYAGTGVSLVSAFPLDVITKIVIGASVSTMPSNGNRLSWDVPFGVELRGGHVRLRSEFLIRSHRFCATITTVF